MKKEKRVVIKIWGDNDCMIPLNGNADTTSPDEILAAEWNDNSLNTAGDGYGWVAYMLPCIIDDEGLVYVPSNLDGATYPTIARGEGY